MASNRRLRLRWMMTKSFQRNGHWSKQKNIISWKCVWSFSGSQQHFQNDENMEAYIVEVNVEVVEPGVYCCSAQQRANVGGRDRECIA